MNASDTGQSLEKKFAMRNEIKHNKVNTDEHLLSANLRTGAASVSGKFNYL